MIRPQDEATEDAERWWQAYLAENDQARELRERADAGDERARRQLASWLAERARTEEAIAVIRLLADAGDDVADLWLARWLADGDHLDELHQRAASGSYPALHELAQWNVTSTWMSCANLLLLTGSCWRAGWPGNMAPIRATAVKRAYGPGLVTTRAAGLG